MYYCQGTTLDCRCTLPYQSYLCPTCYYPQTLYLTFNLFHTSHNSITNNSLVMCPTTEHWCYIAVACKMLDDGKCALDRVMTKELDSLCAVLPQTTSYSSLGFVASNTAGSSCLQAPEVAYHLMVLLIGSTWDTIMQVVPLPES